MPQQPLLQFGPYRFDPARGQLWRQGQVIALPPRALAVFSQLVAQAGQLVTKEALRAAGWPDTAVTEWVLTTCMRDLRRALGDDARQPRYIGTVHRRGYRFMAEVTELAETALEAPDGGTVSPGPPEAAPSAVSSEPLGADAPPGTVAPPAVEPESALAQATGPLPPSSALPSAPMAGTEHRHLTVLSCTFVDVERLTQQLDPEDSYDLMQTLRATTLAIITPHDGHVAQYVHNGVLVYFGYPQAHEDDAQRAVHSGLALVQALGQVGPTGLAGARSGLAVRVGIDTGMVLVPSDAGWWRS